MPTFDAGDVLEALDWNFKAAGVNAKGTIPEPSDAAIGRFLDGLKILYKDLQGVVSADLPADATPDQMLEALSSVSGDAFVKAMADTAGLFADLCGHKPSQDQLLALPLRVRAHFYGWVQNEVVNPEVGPGAGTAVVRSLPSAAAG